MTLGKARRRRSRIRAGRATARCDRMKRTSCSAYWKASRARSYSAIVARRVAAQGQDVLDGRLRVAIEDRGELVPAVADARQVRDRRQPGLPLDPDDQVMGSLPRRAPGAVGHRDERGLQGLELRDRLEQLVRGLVGLGGEELEAEGGGAGLENVLDVHGRSTVLPGPLWRPGHA